MPSSPLVPKDDRSLLFANAGMVQFKDYFTARRRPPFGKAVTVQKCLRAGGKHNDLEQVGKTPLHHTFFEMLGNFSFGDYHKAEAIKLAWHFVTEVLAVAKDNLYVTVHHRDDEAASLWRKVAGLGERRIVKKGDEDNFWSMDKVGPCGPCSEIFYRRDDDYDCEIWNLVFMEQEALADGTTKPLATPGVDTGMGLERIAAVAEGVFDNYKTSLFAPLIAAIDERLNLPAATTASKVIADHLRSSAFLIAEGVLPGNEGRPYVLRRIIRRAVRHGWQCGAKKPLLGSLVDTLLETLGEQWQELGRAKPLIISALEGEEERFLATINRGMQLLADKKPKGGTLDGEVAFMLYDTYGFPLDLTVDILGEDGIKVDESGFARLMAAQKQRGRSAWRGAADGGKLAELEKTLTEKGVAATEFVGYENLSASERVVALFNRNYQPLTELAPSDADAPSDGDAIGNGCLVVTDATPFYATGGGQRCDFGTLGGWRVTDVVKRHGIFLHRLGASPGAKGLKVGQEVELKVELKRRHGLMRHHSATHLLHAALRRVLGLHVSQRGSLVEEDRLRFDISHPKPLADDEMTEVERLVNAQIRGNQSVITDITDKQTALGRGAMALFGETYGERVRVVSMGKNRGSGGDFSVELCGGTHVGELGELGAFALTSQSAVGAGVRRLEAVCAAQAVEYWQRLRVGILATARLLKVAANPIEIETRLKTLLATDKHKGNKGGEKANKSDNGDRGIKAEPPRSKKIGDLNFAWQIAAQATMPQLKGLVDQLKKDNQVAATFAPSEGKVSFAIGTDGKIDAVTLAKAVAEALNGKGAGGRANLAAGGGTNSKGIKKALEVLEKQIGNKE